MARVLITGGAGFIGSNLVKKLLALNYQVAILDRQPPLSAGVEFWRGDFGDEKLLRQAIKPNDIIVHLACTTIPATSEADPAQDFLENVEGTATLLSAAAAAGAKFFIFSSSGGTVYGDRGPAPAKESDPAEPISAHGKMKLAVENRIKKFSKEHNLPFAIIRPANPLGRLSVNKPQGAVDIFLRKALAGETIEIWGDGSRVRDYIHIDDLADLFIKTIERQPSGETINAGTGRGTSLNELLEIIRRETGLAADAEYWPARGFDLRYNVLDIKKADQLLGWQPALSLEEAIKQVYKHLKENKQ